MKGHNLILLLAKRLVHHVEVPVARIFIINVYTILLLDWGIFRKILGVHIFSALWILLLIVAV